MPGIFQAFEGFFLSMQLVGFRKDGKKLDENHDDG